MNRGHSTCDCRISPFTSEVEFSKLTFLTEFQVRKSQEPQQPRGLNPIWQPPFINIEWKLCTTLFICRLVCLREPLKSYMDSILWHLPTDVLTFTSWAGITWYWPAMLIATADVSIMLFRITSPSETWFPPLKSDFSGKLLCVSFFSCPKLYLCKQIR